MDRGGDAGAAANFSREEHFDYDTRYARGLEFVRVAQGLWDSYEDGAFPRDRSTFRSTTTTLSYRAGSAVVALWSASARTLAMHPGQQRRSVSRSPSGLAR